jgi:uncharacterized phiE125 gp8 family phage protein
MILKVITPPAAEPVTLAEAKEHCTVDYNDSDNLLLRLIKAAREYCEKYQGRAYVTQTLELTLDRWGRFPINLPRPPLASVTSIKYYDTADGEHTWAPTEYFVDTDSEPGRVGLRYSKVTPSTTLRPNNGVKIRYVAGYPAGGTTEEPLPLANIPEGVKQAILLLVGHWFRNREPVGQVTEAEILFTLSALLDIDKVVRV